MSTDNGYCHAVPQSDSDCHAQHNNMQSTACTLQRDCNVIVKNHLGWKSIWCTAPEMPSHLTLSDNVTRLSHHLILLDTLILLYNAVHNETLLAGEASPLASNNTAVTL